MTVLYSFYITIMEILQLCHDLKSCKYNRLNNNTYLMPMSAHLNF